MNSSRLTNALLILIAGLLLALLLRPPTELSAFDVLPDARKATLRPDVAARLKATRLVQVVNTVEVTGSVDVNGTVDVGNLYEIAR